ncbi:hypothetical protein C1H46_012503 [Malus baccata]|uniref:Uncharacterized protein n=1 Tax=Malus baccata TaxID=106549 RepID=A0A540MSW1_MALBA|nr:hypothetical protein C1H46_012503 [Malus baccata]
MGFDEINFVLFTFIRKYKLPETAYSLLQSSKNIGKQSVYILPLHFALLDIAKCLYDAIARMERAAEKGKAIAAAVEGVEKHWGTSSSGW